MRSAHGTKSYQTKGGALLLKESKKTALLPLGVLGGKSANKAGEASQPDTDSRGSTQ
jgi:hypothetical protein